MGDFGARRVELVEAASPIDLVGGDRLRDIVAAQVGPRDRSARRYGCVAGEILDVTRERDSRIRAAADDSRGRQRGYE